MPTNPPQIYVYAAGGWRRSTDGGDSWEIPAGPWANSAISSVAGVVDNNRVILYLGTGGADSIVPATQATIESRQAGPLGSGVYRMTSMVPTDIFEDDFEFGDTSAWSITRH